MYLPPVQLKTVGMIAVGMSIKEIAQREGVKTVAIHTRLEKARKSLRLKTNVELVALWERGAFNE